MKIYTVSVYLEFGCLVGDNLNLFAILEDYPFLSEYGIETDIRRTKYLTCKFEGIIVSVEHIDTMIYPRQISCFGIIRNLVFNLTVFHSEKSRQIVCTKDGFSAFMEAEQLFIHILKVMYIATYSI